MAGRGRRYLLVLDGGCRAVATCTADGTAVGPTVELLSVGPGGEQGHPVGGVAAFVDAGSRSD